MQTGDRCVIYTPGGGQWSTPGAAKLAIIEPNLPTVQNGGTDLTRAIDSLVASEEI